MVWRPYTTTTMSKENNLINLQPGGAKMASQVNSNFAASNSRWEFIKERLTEEIHTT